MRNISQKDTDIVDGYVQLIELLPESDASSKQSLENLIGELIRGDPGECFESLAALMRIGTLLDQHAWRGIRRQLQDIYRETQEEPSKAIVSNPKQDPQEMEMAGLTALFGFFSVAGS
jgi:hypothetical protein